MKTALITGASGAIGCAIAEKFLENGYFVVGTYNSSADTLKTLEKKWEFTIMTIAQRIISYKAIAAGLL